MAYFEESKGAWKDKIHPFFSAWFRVFNICLYFIVSNEMMIVDSYMQVKEAIVVHFKSLSQYFPGYAGKP